MSSATFAALSALALAGCVLGPKPADFGPAGANVKLQTIARTGSLRVRGELLAADDSALVVGTPTGQVVQVSYRAIASGGVQRGRSWSGPSLPSREDLRRLRQLSRFPQGISPALLPKVLRAQGRDSLITVRP